MHIELEALLKEIWGKRNNIMSKLSKKRQYDDPLLDDAIWEVYQLYNREDAGGGAVVSTDEAVLKFLNELAGMEDVIGRGPGVQIGNEIQQMPIGQLASMYRSAAQAASTQEAARSKVQIMNLAEALKLGGCFIHYKGFNNNAVDRIYINAARENRATVFGWLMFQMISAQPVAGFCSAKLAAPNDNGRADTILLYMNGEAAAQQAIALLQHYQNDMGFRGHFRAASPRLTTPVQGLIGVSRAQEPPPFYIYKDASDFKVEYCRQSFGCYRATLIVEALYCACNGTFNDFKVSVGGLFFAGGIDVNQPSLQGQALWTI